MVDYADLSYRNNRNIPITIGFEEDGQIRTASIKSYFSFHL